MSFIFVIKNGHLGLTTLTQYHVHSYYIEYLILSKVDRIGYHYRYWIKIVDQLLRRICHHKITCYKTLKINQVLYLKLKWNVGMVITRDLVRGCNLSMQVSYFPSHEDLIYQLHTFEWNWIPVDGTDFQGIWFRLTRLLLKRGNLEHKRYDFVLYRAQDKEFVLVTILYYIYIVTCMYPTFCHHINNNGPALSLRVVKICRDWSICLNIWIKSTQDSRRNSSFRELWTDVRTAGGQRAMTKAHLAFGRIS